MTMKYSQIKGKSRISVLAAVAVLSCSLFTGCVDQSAGNTDKTTEGNSASTQSGSVSTMLEITDPEEKAAVEAAKAKVKGMGEEPKIIATSPSTAEICDRLELDLTGVCSSSVSELPKRYDEVKEVGTAMAPDMEIVASLDPDWILSPATLQSDLQPKYEAIDTDWAFLNLRSVPGMYRSIQELGVIFDREEQAQELVDEFTAFYEDYVTRNEGKESPKVLILDDSTSAVDTKTDALIRKAFREEIPETTKFIIAQRISSIEDADKILVMDGGRIAAMGTHAELLQTCDIYREIYESQTKGGSDDE